MGVTRVLVSVEWGGGMAGVVVDHRGRAWLSRSTEDVTGMRIDGSQPVRSFSDGELRLLGGRLPPGATSAQALGADGVWVDCAAGGGEWIVVLTEVTGWQLSPAVAYRDGEGALIAPALPAKWPRSPVSDTDISCPACGMLAWDQVTPLDGLRGTHGGQHRKRSWHRGNGGEPVPVVVCRACGYEERPGVMVGPPTITPELLAQSRRHAEEWRAQRRADYLRLLAGVTFPLYGADGWPARATGWSREDERVSSVTVGHGSRSRAAAPYLAITTAASKPTRYRGDAATLRFALSQLAFRNGGEWSGGSDAAHWLRVEANARRSQVDAFNARSDRFEIDIDGMPHEFACLTDELRWAGVAHLGQMLITISANGVDRKSLRLRTISDPATTLAFELL